MATMSATTTRLSVAPMPASVRPLAPNASLGGMAKRIRDPALTPVRAVISPGMVSLPWRMNDGVSLVS